MKESKLASIESKGRAIAIYHRVYPHEGFEESAQILFKLVQRAQLQYPGKRRLLYLDIDGHRNSEGGFDADMLELQTKFLGGWLGQYVFEINAPLLKSKNRKWQENEIPVSLAVQDRRDESRRRSWD